MRMQLNIFFLCGGKRMNMLDGFVVKMCKSNTCTTKTESFNSALGILLPNVSDTCVVSIVISKAITNNNFVEDCVHQTFPSSWKSNGCRNLMTMNG
jgi:hypothetical protein